jgi:hypothetical protein
MITFKTFINEAADNILRKPSYNSIQVKEAIKLLNARCKDALWMLTENKPLYRGDDEAEKPVHKTGFATVDPSKTVRKSQNTKNYYTLIFDNHPDMKQYPKRSRSFIATTEIENASGYGDNAFVLIPYDGVKIGVVAAGDMWSHRISLFDDEFGDRIEAVNSSFSRIPELKLATSWKDWEQFDKKLKHNDINAIKNFENAFGGFEDEEAIAFKRYYNGFLKEVFRAYSPYVLGFTCQTTKTLNHNLDSEVWVGGPCMLISESMWKKMIEALNEESK